MHGLLHAVLVVRHVRRAPGDVRRPTRARRKVHRLARARALRRRPFAARSGHRVFRAVQRENGPGDDGPGDDGPCDDSGDGTRRCDVRARLVFARRAPRHHVHAAAGHYRSRWLTGRGRRHTSHIRRLAVRLTTQKRRFFAANAYTLESDRIRIFIFRL